MFSRLGGCPSRNFRGRGKAARPARMQVRAHVRDVVGLGLVAVFIVAGQPVLEEFRETPLALRGASLEPARDRGNAAVDTEHLQHRRPVSAIERHSIQPEFDRRRCHGNGRQCLEVIGQLPMDPRPKGADLRLGGSGLHRYDQITFTSAPPRQPASRPPFPARPSRCRRSPQ